jgi:hypothetical protein
MQELFIKIDENDSDTAHVYTPDRRVGLLHIAAIHVDMIENMLGRRVMDSFSPDNRAEWVEISAKIVGEPREAA